MSITTPRLPCPAAILLASWLLCLACIAQPAARDLDLIIAVGAPGEAEYAEKFKQAATAWTAAGAKAGVKADIIGLSGTSEKAEDASALGEKTKAAAAKPAGALWIVLIGHGTFDGRESRFNLRGDDVTPGQIAEWLKESKREIVLVAGGSASGSFTKEISGPGRIVVTGTKSADEVFYARFGEHMARAIGGEPEADLDQDHQVSLLEAFLFGSRKTAEFYETEGRLATEHALLEDNGDGIGTRAEVFRGVVPETKEGGPKPDGERARQVALVLSEDEARLTDAQRKDRDQLEIEIRALAAKRPSMKDDDYYREMEALMLRLARIYHGG